MKNLLKKTEILSDFKGGQENFFLLGIFLFFAILILGLFPIEETGLILGDDSFLFILITIPVVIALYLITVSFRRNFYLDNINRISGLRYKIGLALVFVAIIPLFLTIFASNSFIKNTIDELVSKQNKNKLEHNSLILKEEANLLYARIEKEINFLNAFLKNKNLDLFKQIDREQLRSIYKTKNLKVYIYKIIPPNLNLRLIDLPETSTSQKIAEFLTYANFSKKFRIDKISLADREILLGTLKQKNNLIVLSDQDSVFNNKRIKLFAASQKNQSKVEQVVINFKNGYRFYLLFISVVIVVISIFISFFISKNITRPVLELIRAVRELAAGNFKVRLKRNSRDELDILFDSFNQMVHELDSNRNLLYEKQKLEAWRDIAKNLVHEIKNPLTPILLSAERIRKKLSPKRSQLQETIFNSTETIIEEVKALNNILREFTKFARLPEMKREELKLEPLLENIYQSFQDREGIKFHLEVKNDLPRVAVDKIFIKQAINNIILNAIDAIKESGNIYLQAEYLAKPEALVKITIKDDGEGIKKNQINDIFELGFSTKTSGMGLGLAIVKKIIMDHDGQVKCFSKYGQGTTFIIKLFLSKKRIKNG